MSNIDRRGFLRTAASLVASTFASNSLCAGTELTPRIRGMLIGLLIGGALGGPIEFLSVEDVGSVMPDARSWEPDKVVDAPIRKQLAGSLQMHSYSQLRPETAAYGPWIASAPRGTITDDSRHKIILLRTLREMLSANRNLITQQDLARQFVAFQPRQDRKPDASLLELVDEGLREYRYAARWILGERDPDVALPVERIWSGIANCSGQMVLLPLAAVFPGDSDTAYRETYAIDFVDAPVTRDIAAAINAGLYQSRDLQSMPLDGATRWLAALHRIPVSPNEIPVSPNEEERIGNRALRELNHSHMFQTPLQSPSAISLDDICNGLENLAAKLRESQRIQEAMRELGKTYLASGSCLLHGDFYPGSWLQTKDGFRVIDPEFCFPGPADFDLGVLAGHRILIGGSVDSADVVIDRYCKSEGKQVDRRLIRGFAAVEVIRRLIGVAQLPLHASLEQRAEMSRVARSLV